MEEDSEPVTEQNTDLTKKQAIKNLENQSVGVSQAIENQTHQLSDSFNSATKTVLKTITKESQKLLIGKRFSHSI